MTDDVEKLEQSAKKTAGELDKLSKVSQSTHDTLRKNAKSEEGARKITNLYIRAKQEELRQLRASKQDQTDAGKIKRIQLLQELSSIRQSTRKQGLFAAVATKATTGLKSFRQDYRPRWSRAYWPLAKAYSTPVRDSWMPNKESKASAMR